MNTPYMSLELYEQREHKAREVFIDIKSKPMNQGYLALNSFFVKNRNKISKPRNHLFLSVSVWDGEGSTHVKYMCIKDKPLMEALKDLESLKDVYRKTW